MCTDIINSCGKLAGELHITSCSGELPASSLNSDLSSLEFCDAFKSVSHLSRTASMRIVEPEPSSLKQPFSCCCDSYHLFMMGVNFENKDIVSCKNLNTVNLLLVISECAVLLEREI